MRVWVPPPPMEAPHLLSMAAKRDELVEATSHPCLPYHGADAVGLHYA